MKKTYIYLLFGLMVIAQIVASAQIVYKHETVINSGNVYKFTTAPIDPSDPFRGKYIVLDFDINSFPTTDEDWNYGEKAYLYLGKNANGYAYIDTLSKTKLANNPNDYILVELGSHYNGKIHFDLPFDTYYMEESKAYDAELLYRENNRRGEAQEVYAVVHIQEGTHVLTDVVVNGISIKDAVKK
ncbi:GDYXXLXY motif protein [Kordia periserrulae]|uniref:GDYXXLXY motif protein n=1 Tax=Kordia periserrulae TaxID=701523 RepID=A0A2T6BRQ4_9FLAO|nr:GDYXXLXY domain-containing protein [Kordia periserrulae]PTX58724.1 GDYXXLXY motif protein [Kordia periserrulae]